MSEYVDYLIDGPGPRVSPPGWRQKYNESQAEVGRLRKEVKRWRSCAEKQKEALRLITLITKKFDGGDWDELEEAQQIAQLAFEEKVQE